MFDDVGFLLVFLATLTVACLVGSFSKSFSAVGVIMSICGHRVRHGWFNDAVPFEPWMFFSLKSFIVTFDKIDLRY